MLNRTLNISTILIIFLFSNFEINAQIITDSQNKRLTGNWHGIRTQLENNGINFNSIYTGEIINNLYGGFRTGASYLDIIDFILDIDFIHFPILKNTNFYIDFLGIHGKDPSEHIGDFQGVTNIAAPQKWQLYEFWLQHSFFEDKFSILYGLYDLNSEFDIIETAGLFINSSHGMGAEFSHSGKNGPSTFPSTALSFRIKTQLNDHLSLQTVILDGVPDESDKRMGINCDINRNDGALFSSEFIITMNSDQKVRSPWRSYRKQIFHQRRGFGKYKTMPHYLSKRMKNKTAYSPRKFCPFKMNFQEKKYSKFVIGSWYYTADHHTMLNYDESIITQQSQKNWGIYCFWERRIQFEPEKSVSYFIRMGMSNKDSNNIHNYFGLGMVYEGILPNYQDQIGIAVAAVKMDKEYSHLFIQNIEQYKNWELNFEISYRIELIDFLSLQPDLQYIVNPGFNAEINNALCAGTRVEISF